MKHNFGLLNSDIENIILILNKQTKIENAFIFGSRAKGNFKNGSDVDIALKGTELDFDTVSQISYLLNEETNMPYKFDVLDYNKINEPQLKEHIDRVGIEFYRRHKMNKTKTLHEI